MKTGRRRDSGAAVPAAAFWQSRSDDVVVAVGFSPRSRPRADASRSDAVNLPHGVQTALRDVFVADSFRGMKPTATIIASLREAGGARPPERTHLLQRGLRPSPSGC